MIAFRRTHAARLSILTATLAITGARVGAQTQPTIPIVVAQAMNLEPSFIGKPQYFDGRPPTDWPADLVPAGARVLGGGIIGDPSMFRLRAAVFAFSEQGDPMEIVRALVTRAGYSRFQQMPPKTGGFVATDPPPGIPEQYCKASTMVTFGAVDSLHAPRVIAIDVVDGEGARQSCTQQPDMSMMRHLPVTVPPLTPPPGATTTGGGGSSWSGSGGTVTSSVVTTIPADSVLAHYARQLVAGGWKAEGKAAAANGIAVQKFSFRDADADWSAALIVLAAGDRRELKIEYARID
ncbi:MAG TPA: hypothetical protein VN706_12845 [Gemmatimonadaceae bacterium]|nr:hypothetical protein [Gemmatimonadaceae bacterium]